jgi:uncharacterized protein
MHFYSKISCLCTAVVYRAADWNCEAMSREFPDFVDPWKAADGQRTFQGTMPIKRMQRLERLLAPKGSGSDEAVLTRDVVRFVAKFSHDRQDLITIQLDVEAELPLVCQRSLEPYREKVNRRSVLVVIEDVTEQELIPELYDPVLVENRRMALLDIVEEELLLAVPQVPRDPGSTPVELSTDGQISSPSVAEKEPGQKPFAGLAGLMKSDLEN